MSTVVVTPPPGGSSGGDCKRGIAYNDGSLTSAFTASDNICWGYNWGNAGSLSGAEFVPMCWGDKFDFFAQWPAKAQAAISSGSKHLFSFNEPDMTGQAGDALYDWNVAAAAHIRLMNPFGGQGVQIGAPSVTSDYGSDGSNGVFRSFYWLTKFFEACDQQGGCTADFINTHWYGGCDLSAFQMYIQDMLHPAFPGKDIWVTEFKGECDEASQAQFIQASAQWMDGIPYIKKYAYFHVDSVLTSGSSPNSLGLAYIDA